MNLELPLELQKIICNGSLEIFYDKLENPYKYTYKWPGMQSYYSDGSWGGSGVAGREGIWWDLDNLREDEMKAIYGEATVSVSEKVEINFWHEKV